MLENLEKVKRTIGESVIFLVEGDTFESEINIFATDVGEEPTPFDS